MTRRDVLTPEFEQKLAEAVDAILSALAEGDSLESDAGTTIRTLQAYLVQQNRIAAAAGRDGNAGLHTTCAFMNANLMDLVVRGTTLSAREHELISGWPGALVEYCADPSNPDAVAALVAHVSDAVWPSPLSAEEAQSLERMILAVEGQAATVSQTEDAQSEYDVSNCHSDDAPAIAACAEPTFPCACADPAAMTADVSFTKIPYATRVAWMADLAERKGLVGIQEVCERAARVVAACETQDDGISDNASEHLDELLGLAKSALADVLDPVLAERLLALLGDPVWPEPLVGDERELVAELLQADMLALASSASEPDDKKPGEPGEERTSPNLPAEQSGDDSCDWQREQTVSDELLALLAAEIGSAGAALRQSLDAACAGDDTGIGEAAEQFADEMERIGATAGSVGLSALQEFLERLKRVFAGRQSLRPNPQQRDVLALFTGALAAYLAAPTNPSTAEGLVDLLRSDAWGVSVDTADAARLVRALGLVKVSHDVVTAPARQTEATAADVSLAFPEDINQELLDGLLLELPLQTSEFSNAMQNIAGGHGSIGDLDAAKRAAHTLKGAANTVGVRGIANLTHHIEDILIALSAHQALPNGALAEALVRASDCLEAMSEAVTGTGGEPGDALAVLQDVLNWANRIDTDGIAAMREAPRRVHVEQKANTAQPMAETSAVASGPMVRVPAALIDELLRLVGETVIATGQIRDRLTKLAGNHRGVREQAGFFLRLTNELEALVDIGIGAGPVRAQPKEAEFDPLEFDHYSELHSVSRRLIESATDAREMGAGVDDDLGELRELVETQERIHRETQAVVMQTRMVPVSTVVSRLQRGVRQACRLLDKEASLRVLGSDTLIDSNILNELIDPLMHVLRNAVDHGIESAAARTAAGKPASGQIELAFAREGDQVVVRCRDDGGGLDFASIRRSAEEKGLVTTEHAMSEDELGRVILVPGFSTRDEATQVSGRGIGMDIVRSRIQQLKGSLNLHSRASAGLTVEMRLPAALISTHALIIRSGARRVAVSSHGIQDIHYVLPDQVQRTAGSVTYRIGDNQLQVSEIETLLGLPNDRRNDVRHGFPLLIVRLDSGKLCAVRVHEVLQSRDIVVKALGRFVPKLRGVVGATILGDGSVASVVDLPDMLAVPAKLPQGLTAAGGTSIDDADDRGMGSQLRALVVDDSLSARRATAQFMRDAGFDVRTAIDGLEAVSILEKWTPSVLLVDMEMPRMSGLELTTHVRATKGALAQVPIIMITSRSTAKHRKQAEAAGVSVYLTKPFSDEELLKHVTQLATTRHGS